MSGTIIDALERAAGGPRGVTLLGTRDGERRLGWADLRARALDAARALAAAGARPGDRLLLVLPTSEEFLALFLGAAWLGAVPCPVSPPQGFGVKAAFARRIAALARGVGARAVITDDDGAAVLASGDASAAAVQAAAGAAALAAGAAGAAAAAAARAAAAATAADADAPGPVDRWTTTRLRGLSPGAAPDRRPSDDAPAFIQFTSGTTDASKGVVLQHRAVLANVAQIGEGAGIDAGSVIVSWLPLFHDMGLVGGLLTALARDVDLVLSSPFGFVRRPGSWLDAITRFRGTHSPAPTFAYRAVLDRLDAATEARLDLASWRVAFVGAEAVPADVLEAFAARLGPRGLGRDVLMPCYGLAEATLAVTFAPPGRRFAWVEASRRALSGEGRLAPPASADDARRLVSCGPPLRGCEVAIEDEAGRPLPAGREGEVVVRGPGLSSGYFGRAPRAAGEPLRTGDLGLLLPPGTPGAGELVVTGRRKDLVILRGENHDPAEIEWAAGRVAGVRDGRVAAFGVDDAATGTEALVLVCEVDRRAEQGEADVALAVRRAVGDEVGLAVSDVRLVGPGELPVTTSGKVQRARARLEYLAARVPGAGARDRA